METNDWNIQIEDVIKINADEGDTLLVTLPEASEKLPTTVLGNMIQRVGDAFNEVFKDKDIKVIVVPYGMEVQLIKSSTLKDK